MNLLILHKRAYEQMQYHRGVDHSQHQVVYIGTENHLRSIPADLACRRIPRPGRASAATEVLAIVEQMKASLPEKFDRLVAFSEMDLLDAAILREALDIPGPRYADVLRVRDKVHMKAAVQAAGLRVPRHLRASALLADRDPTIPWQGRTVLKPVDGAFSENVQLYDRATLAAAAIRDGAHGLRKFDPEHFEIEEFVEGEVVHFDGLMVDRIPHAMLAGRCVGTPLRYAAGEPFGSLPFDASPELLSWAGDCLRAVGLETSSFHLEAILTPEGPVFLEVGGRPGGADIIECFALATRLHLPSLELAALLDPASVRERLPVREVGRKYGWFVFPGHHLGTRYCEVRGADPFLRHPHMVHASVLSEDMPIHPRISYLAGEAPFVGRLAADTTAELEATMRRLFDHVSIVPRTA